MLCTDHVCNREQLYEEYVINPMRDTNNMQKRTIMKLCVHWFQRFALI